MVDGKPLTMTDLNALEQITTEIEDKSYTGVRFLDVIEAAGVTAGKLVMIASDGYSSYVDVADLTDESLLAYNENGRLNAVLPGASRSQWVQDLIELQVAPEVEAQPTGAEAEAKPVPTLAGPIELTDAAGQTLKLDSLPQRIVVMGRGPHMVLHLLYMFPQARERLVGIESKSATSNDFASVVDPDLNTRTVLAANPGPEQIAALKPDLVIMRGIATEPMGESLSQIGIPVLYLWMETPEYFMQDVENLGAVLGNPQRAEEIKSFYQTRLDRLAEGIADMSEGEKSRVLLLEYNDRSGEVAVRVPAKSWIQTVEVETAGGAPVWLESAEATDGWTVVNLEQIAVWDPDKIFLVIWYTLDPEEVLATLKADAKWGALKAVREDQLYGFPTDIFGWDSPDPRWILGMQWLATRIYPDRFADVDMTDQVYAFFEQLYGMDRAAIDAEIMPKVNLDVH
ncbi:MAG: ABC transporter substrate-binding protein [Chloroflexi bacterium]|nr:ABC transporter substrate-binding protein [Chloroflexota bacterium]